MRKLILAVLASLTLPAAGCRLFCDDYPSQHYRYNTPPVVVPAAPAPAAAPPY